MLRFRRSGWRAPLSNEKLTGGHTMSDSRKPATTRRDAVKLGLFSGLTALTAGGLRNAFAADTVSPLLTRVIPSTGEKLPCVGIGTNSFALADVPNLQVVLKRMYELGGTFIVDNKAGATGTIGAGQVKRAAPDGSKIGRAHV